VTLVAYGTEERVVALRTAFGEVVTEHVDDGWAENWRAFHRGVRVGPLWVGPPWESAPAGVSAVVIDPGRAFGTGAHATTRLCLELLADLPPGSLLDAGCGSGVLAIAGARLGHAPVIAVDNDPAAVEATVANAEANGVAVDVRLGDLGSPQLDRFDAVVANVTRADVVDLASRLRARKLVTSGYLESDATPLAGWAHETRRTAAGWAADLWRSEAE
jgi:ribosomal protein L11 methyltransferase